MAHGHVISDLHLFTPWTAAERHVDSMIDAARRADFFVLNGDIFDFRWTTLPSVERSVEAAADWLADFAGRCPDCRVTFVMGNHDGLAAFAERLDRAVREVANLDWHPAYARIGPALFAHGDLFLQAGVTDPLDRPLQTRIRRRPRSLSRCYHLLHTMRIHRWPAKVYTNGQCVRRFARRLDAADPRAIDGVTDVYFGHTHLPFTDVRHNGYTFHNTGSIIGGLNWHMLTVDVG